ncbi:MAG: chemotaxis protein CheW, partial [Paeniclostridium sordellii]|nr:chemotaxis protein CheW [Paeniclostridium sordellii]
IRDLSVELKKEINFIIEGSETELDRTVIDEIGEPLIHLLRNAADHGIETKEERITKGKDPVGTIRLVAYQEGTKALIKVTDDGAGINLEKVKAKAEKVGINTDGLSDNDIRNLIFAQGFSTNTVVTDISGRGVGMDVVYTNIRKLRGSITIDSEHGKGTMIVLRIPLTLAIVDGMKVKIGDEIFIIPSLNIKEVFRQGAYEIVKNPNGEEHSIIRGNCYEIRRLSKILGLDNKKTDEGIMILVESEMGNVCIIVDSIIGQQQVVIKPVPTLLTQFEKVHSYISGCSILEDGSISLIFDVNAIINL